MEVENMKIVVKDLGGNEYQAFTDTNGVDRILVTKPMGGTETAWVMVEVSYAPEVVEEMLKESAVE